MLWEELHPRWAVCILQWPSALLPKKVCCCCWLVVTLSPLPSRTGTGSTGHMFTYSSSPKCWRTGRTLSILVSLVLAALTDGNKPQVSSASLWGLESVWVSLGKVTVLCLLAAWGKNGAEIVVFVTSVAQENSSKCPAASDSNFAFNSYTGRYQAKNMKNCPV